MKPPTQDELRLQRRYMVDGRQVPYSVAVDTVERPRHCIIGDVHLVAETGSNLCVDCTSQLRSDLRMIEDRWENLEDELMTVRQKSNGERPGSSAEGSAAPIDLDISEAMGLARDAVWAIIARLTQDRKTDQFRTDEGTWALAGMLGRYYVGYIASHPDQDFSERVYRMVWSAGRKVEDVVHPPAARRPIESPCHQQLKADGGSGPCPGQLEAVIGAGGSKIVECSADPLHRMPIEDWLRISGHRATKKSRLPAKLAAKYGPKDRAAS